MEIGAAQIVSGGFFIVAAVFALALAAILLWSFRGTHKRRSGRASLAVLDENGVQYVSWTYNSYGQALTSQLANNVNATSVTYNSDLSETVTDALGAVRTFRYVRVGDVNRPYSIVRGLSSMVYCPWSIVRP